MLRRLTSWRCIIIIIYYLLIQCMLLFANFCTEKVPQTLADYNGRVDQASIMLRHRVGPVVKFW